MENLAPSNALTDSYARNIPQLLSADVVRKLSRLNVFTTAFQITREWLQILAAIWICTHFWHPLLYIITVMWIGAGQHALAILMHDGAHHRLCTNKRVNDVICELFLAWPLFITMKAYRDTHFPHHRYVNTDQDPDLLRKQQTASEEWNFPKNWKNLGVILLKDMLGFNTVQQILEITHGADPRATDRTTQLTKQLYFFGRISFYLSVAALLTYFHAWTLFFLFWLVPALTWFKTILRIRSITEHFALEYADLFSGTRTTYITSFERMFIAPRDVNYHLDHHLFPTIPAYNLPKAHKLLLQVPEYRQKAHISKSYFAALKECLSCKDVRLPLKQVLGT